MSQKVYIKPPAPTRTVLIAQIVVVSLFLPLGVLFVFVAEGEARPFVAIFSLIWTVACVAILINAVKMLKLVKTGKIEIAEYVDASSGNTVAERLRNLESLKKEHLISEDEYQEKRAEIMKEKW